jgi:hypothetical protein
MCTRTCEPALSTSVELMSTKLLFMSLRVALSASTNVLSWMNARDWSNSFREELLMLIVEPPRTTSLHGVRGQAHKAALSAQAVHSHALRCTRQQEASVLRLHVCLAQLWQTLQKMRHSVKRLHRAETRANDDCT